MIYLEEIPEKQHHSKYKWVKSDIIDFMIGIKIYSNIFENFDPAPVWNVINVMKVQQ